MLNISLTDHLAVDEIIVLCKGRFIFQQYLSVKHKQFGIKLYYKLYDSKLYTYNMTVCSCKDRKHVTPSSRATHATITELTRIENVQQKLYMDNFFSSPSDKLHIKTINSSSTVRPNRKGILKNFGHEINMKSGDKD